MKKTYIKLLNVCVCVFLQTVVYAQEPVLKWIASQDGMGLEITDVVKESTDGCVFFLNNFSSSAKETSYNPDGSVKEGYSVCTDYFYYDLADGIKKSEKTLAGVPDVVSVSGNKNLTLYKTDTNGHVIWSLHSDVGVYAGGALAATSDGGAFLFLKMRHSCKGTYESNVLCRLVDMQGKTTSVLWEAPDYSTYGGVYQPVLVKVSKDGKVEWTRRIEVEYKIEKNCRYSDNFEIGDVVTDAQGNVYLAGVYRTSIYFGRNANLLSPRNVEGWNGDTQIARGDMFIVKLNAEGEAQWHVVTKGQAVRCEMPRSLVLDGDQLYVSGYMKGDGEKTVVLGNERLVPTDKDCLFYVCLSITDAHVQWAHLLQTVPHPKVQKGARVKPMCMAVCKDALFLGGSFFGNVQEGERVWLENDNPATNGLRAYILKCNKSDGTVLKTVKIDGGLTEVESILFYKNKILAPGYDLYGGSYLYMLDSNLSQENLVTYTLKTSPMSATQGGVLIGDLLISAMNANRTASFPGCNWTLDVVNNGSSNYRACLFTGHDLSDKPVKLTGNVDMSKSFIVYATPGGIIIETSRSCLVQVFDLLGRSVSSLLASQGKTKHNLPQGIYVVNGQKVLVF